MASGSGEPDPSEIAVRNYLASLSDPDLFRRGFVEHARAWAEAQSIPASAFLQMGVPPEVLHEAGLDEGAVGPDDEPPAAAKAQPSENDVRARAEPRRTAPAIWRRWTVCGMSRRFYRMMNGHPTHGRSHPPQ